MGQNEVRFVQLAVADGQLYGLREEGDVWQNDWNKALWKRLPMRSGGVDDH